MDEMDGFDPLADDLKAVGSAVDAATVTTKTFAETLKSMQSAAEMTDRQVSKLSVGISRGLGRAFDGLVFDGLKLSDTMKQVGRSMLNTAYRSAIDPVVKQAGSSLSSGIGNLVGSIMPFANGASFSQGKILPFAQGGIVSQPTTFPMRGATGLMGEAGPEAIMPLARGPDGKLGVRSGGAAGPVQIVMNIQTPDAESFRRSQSQIAAQMGRALSRGNRNR